ARYADTDSDNQIDDLVATSSQSYDSAGRLTDLVHAQGATQFAGYNWTFDAAGRIMQFVHTDYLNVTHTSDYTYDDAGQLTAANHNGSQTNEAYTYDDNGNRITGNGKTYATGGQNRMTSDGTYTYQYDKDGNRTLNSKLSLNVYVVGADTGFKKIGQNLRTQAHRIIKRAGLKPWPKVFQNCRSTRETELVE
ncbi:MAG: hypothetical protein GY794_07890, partial [bacterium]|nr:hypothetical protein [bacterium]